MTDKTPRRLFLQGAYLTSLETRAGGCGSRSTCEGVLPRSGPARRAPAGNGRYKEAPMLAARVAAGKLPPVEQRLPKNPIVRHVPQIGRYGGSLYDHTESPGGRLVANARYPLHPAPISLDTPSRPFRRRSFNVMLRPRAAPILGTLSDLRRFAL